MKLEIALLATLALLALVMIAAAIALVLH